MIENNETKYPDYIVESVRRNLGLDINDNSMDNEINDMDPDEVLERYWTWNNIIGFSERIKESVADIYGIDFDCREFYEL